MKAWNGFLLALLVVVLLAILSVVFLVNRGFRASTAPSAWEVATATRIRNYAIPSGERNKSNPVAFTSDSLRHGRDLFLARCAGCHGVDGSGHTPIGSNTYPRVPDLRSDSTQSLRDGQLHYIIENGVQLTGMPAFSSAGSSADSWNLVVFVRS